MIRTPLDPERWERAAEIFERALDAPRNARDKLIESEAGGDAEIIATVRGMLAADENTGDMIDRGVDALASIAFGADGSAAPLSPGDKVGDFEIISEIGRGGMGVVYAARDRKLGRVAALKLLPPESLLDAEASERLIAEAQAASALDHPNVATIYQIGETADGRGFIAMARYEGETLRERLRNGPIAPREAFAIARQVASGLAAAHAAGLVHRDVKPENIFLTRQGLAKLLDFGIATLAGTVRESQTTRGTIMYMSPEHVNRQTPGKSSDVWALGVVLYEMLAGRTPFNGETPRDILLQITDSTPIRLPPVVKQMPSAAGAVLTRSLEKDQRRRFGDAQELLAHIERAEKIWTRPRLIQAGIAAAAVIAFAGWYALHSIAPPPVDRTVPSLAVLPVTGDSIDRESVALTSALGEEIAARIAGLGRMRLVQMSSESAYRSRIPGLHLMKLSMDRGQFLPMIAVSLERADSRKTIWSTRRPLDRSELREISRDLVIGTLAAIGKPLNERERAAIGSSFPSNSMAYEEFLRGNQLMSQRTPSAVESAMVSFRRASMLDTTFASALARQSYAYTLLVDWGWQPTAQFPGNAVNEGLALADRATQLDSTSADAWLAKAYLLVQRDPARFKGSIEAFQHAIALDPYNAEAFHQYGQTLMALGRYNEALAAYRRVLDLEPNRAMTLVPMAAIAKRQGRRLEALRYLDSAIAAFPRIPYVRANRALVKAQLGDLAGARVDAEAAVAIPSTSRIPQLAALARILWLQGDTARAIARLVEAENNMVNPSGPNPTDAYWLELGEITAGRIDKAKNLLRTTLPRGALMWFMSQADELAEFRKDPEVGALLSQIDPRSPAQ